MYKMRNAESQPSRYSSGCALCAQWGVSPERTSWVKAYSTRCHFAWLITYNCRRPCGGIRLINGLVIRPSVFGLSRIYARLLLNVTCVTKIIII